MLGRMWGALSDEQQVTYKNMASVSAGVHVQGQGQQGVVKATAMIGSGAGAGVSGHGHVDDGKESDDGRNPSATGGADAGADAMALTEASEADAQLAGLTRAASVTSSLATATTRVRAHHREIHPGNIIGDRHTRTRAKPNNYRPLPLSL